jgi:hypothetical protein
LPVSSNQKHNYKIKYAIRRNALIPYGNEEKTMDEEKTYP